MINTPIWDVAISINYIVTNIMVVFRIISNEIILMRIIHFDTI